MSFQWPSGGLCRAAQQSWAEEDTFWVDGCVKEKEERLKRGDL